MAGRPRALIVVARFYADIADELLDGAIARLEASRIAYETLQVPGVLEIPPALAMALTSARRADRSFDMFIVLGCVIRGETSHYDIVAGEANRAIMDLAVERRLAIGNGILTVENQEQARVRAAPSGRDKGGAAAAAAIALFELRSLINQ